MNASDLFERRAERGRHRGAPEVWADAHHAVHAEQATSAAPGHAPRWWSVAGFRVAFAAISVAALAALTLPLDVFSTELDPVAAPAVEEEEVEETGEAADEESKPPAQLLIEDMTLKTVFEPDSDRRLDGGDSSIIPIPPFQSTVLGAKLWVFVDQVDPYVKPVLVGSASESSEGLAVIGGNVPFAESIIEFEDGEWRLIDEAGDYALAAEFDSPDQVVLNAWELEFVDDADSSDQALWQAATHNGAQEWLWVVRLAGSSSSSSLSPIEVLGRPGVELVDDNGNSHVLWTDADQAFRMTAFSSDDTSSSSVRSAEVARRLYEADDDEWGQAIADAGDPNGIGVRVETIEIPLSYLASGLGVLIAVGFLGWLVYRERSSTRKSGDE